MMHTAVLLHLSVASAAFNPNQRRASPGLFELPKEPFALLQKENPSTLLQEAAAPSCPAQSYPQQVPARLCPSPLSPL